MKAKESATELLEQKVALEKEIKVVEQEEKELKAKVDSGLRLLGNLVHHSVPVSKDEEENKIERTWGEFPNRKAEGALNHVDCLYRTGLVDIERGSNIAGNRGYFLRGDLVLLNQALINYGLAFMRQKGYTAVQVPYFMNKDAMSNTAQLEQFDEELYKVIGGEGEEKYLIATSEQPISCMHMNEWLQPADLPMRYSGYSTNFRKEVGSHGRDTLGIFRTHQFEKIEQFVLCSPEDSWSEHERMIACSEEFYQSLNVPYRVVNIVSGALNNAAAKKYDLEAWFPGSAAFRELVSCSNCTDYQARRLEIRHGFKKNVPGQDVNKKDYVHMLNSTLTATERTLCCLVEWGQEAEGIRIPPVLVPYMGGIDFIPFVRGTMEEEKKKEKNVSGKGKGGKEKEKGKGKGKGTEEEEKK